MNFIEITRKRLSFDEAVTAIILRHKGHTYHAIAQMLGTNPHRIGEVFRGKTHPAACMAALALLSGLNKYSRQAA